MNATQVDRIWPIPEDSEEAERQLAELLKLARKNSLRVSLAGARHSMGGHTLYPGGIVIDTIPFKKMELHEENNILTVQSGALWKDVIAYLDARGRSCNPTILSRPEVRSASIATVGNTDVRRLHRLFRAFV